VLLSETKLNREHVLKFENYNIIRNDRNSKHPGGGTAILIKRNIKYEEIILSETEKVKILEHTIIKLNITNNSVLYLIVAYARSGYQKEFMPNINKLFSTLKLDQLRNYYILAGDLNAKHMDWKNNNPRGIALKTWVERNNITYKIRLLSTKYPSYPNRNSFLDIVLTDARLKFHGINENSNNLENI